MSDLQEDLLFALTGDSYGENLHVDTTAKSILEDITPVIKKAMLEIYCKAQDTSPVKEPIEFTDAFNKLVEEL